MSKFQEDLEIGHSTEQKVLKLLQTQYPSARILDGYCKEMDIFVPETGKGYCLLYTSPSPRDRTRSRMPSSA